jgi:UDP-glucose 4-epimerase
MLGFDPRLAVIHHDDVVAALAHAARHELAGAYNAAADGVLVLSEIASLLGKTLLPVLPPVGTGFAAAQLRRLGLKAPVELARQLRHGRALDNRRLKASGFSPAYTSREALLQLRAQQQLRPLLTSGQEPYRYEPDLEEFLRWSPSVRRTAQNTGDEVADPLAELSEHELVHLIDSLEPEALRDLRSYEEAHQARPAVLEALERNLARQPG